ncbi:hypothetical protein DV706_13305 [Natronorubrum bangense]|uniref:Uncharacterized protein n=4 Tax=Natronorubrum bangense TaxID=61858 RepID=L9WN04_9EURY|nr:hypothetical protein C494_06900 [Natronorubrum bangense JCM 10635]QCC55355.1 hypothetical protein DV706_13305 [Natronorubrum bangense]
MARFFTRAFDARDRAIRRLIRNMDYTEARESYDGQERTVHEAEDRLVFHFRTTFSEYIFRRIGRLLVIAILLGSAVHWLIRPVPLQTYGILLNLQGSVIIATNSWHGRYLIAQRTDNSEPGSDEMDIQAERTMRTMAGLTAFLAGFTVQLFVVSTEFALLFTAVILLSGILNLKDWL